MKWLFDAKIFLIFSMIRSEKLAKLLDYFKNKKFWTFIGKTGIFLGFGFLGLYYWYRFDKRRWKKIILWQVLILIISVPLILLLSTSLGLINAIIAFVVFNLFGLAGFSFYILGFYTIKIIINYIVGKASCPGVAPVVPGVKIPGVPLYIPAIEGWLSILIILVLHEAAHGILSRVIKVKVKSFGLLLIGFLPIGAFTEPDEKELESSKGKDQLLVYSSGPMINFYLAILIFILAAGFAFVTFGYTQGVHNSIVDGVFIVGFSEYTGLCNDGVKSVNYNMNDANAKIVVVDGTEIKDMNAFTYSQTLAKKNKQEYSTFTLQKDGNTYDENIYYNSDGKIGVQVIEKTKDGAVIPFGYKIIDFFMTLFYWLALLSLMVAIFNFLPSEPFDGGKMAKIILSEFIFKEFPRRKQYRLIGIIFGILILIMFLVNLLPLFF